MRKILFIDAAHPFLRERLEQLGFECRLDYDTPKAALELQLEDFFGIVCRSRFSLDKDFLKSGKNLRFIARVGVGTEHIATDFAEKKGIQVLTSPEGSRNTVAEHAVGLLLCLMNNLAKADREMRNRQWIRKQNVGAEIFGKTVGILGYGNMGQAFAKRLSGFGCRVVAYDRFRTNYGDEFAEEADLDTLWQESDILSIHIPHSIDNQYFIDDRFIKNFRKNIWLVNTARGSVLNTADLVKHLKNGKVHGAALDVLEYEEGSFNKLNFEKLPEPFHFLSKADNVVLSPHLAGSSYESWLAHARVLAEKIEKLFTS